MSRPEINLMHDAGGKVGPLVPFEGREPAAPSWFHRAISVKPEILTARSSCGKLNVLRWGDREKPGIVFVHGNGAHAWWWAFIAPFLADDYSVAAFDLSGMGDSDWCAHYAMDLFADEPVAVAEVCGMFEGGRRPVIVGHSFGGFTTMLCGAKHGERLAGTVFVDAPVHRPGEHHGPPHREPRPHNVYPTLAAALTRFRLAPEQPCDNLFLVDYVARRSLKEVDGGFSWKFDPAMWSRLVRAESNGPFQKVDCRMALLRGEQSVLMTREVETYMTALLNETVPSSAIPEAQHHVMMDQPMAFVATLRAILAEWAHSTPDRGCR